MAWFSGKSNHQKQVEAAYKVAVNLYVKTTDGGADAPLVLSFRQTDSRFRYLMFCLSTMQTACARYMKNLDAVLNEVAHTLVGAAVTDFAQTFFAGAVEPQRTANQAAEYVQDYLHRWSAYLDVAEGGNTTAATSLVYGMLLSAESMSPATDADGPRLWPLATWIEEHLGAMGSAFTDMAR